MKEEDILSKILSDFDVLIARARMLQATGGVQKESLPQVADTLALLQKDVARFKESADYYIEQSGLTEKEIENTIQGKTEIGKKARDFFKKAEILRKEAELYKKRYETHLEDLQKKSKGDSGQGDKKEYKKKFRGLGGDQKWKKI